MGGRNWEIGGKLDFSHMCYDGASTRSCACSVRSLINLAERLTRRVPGRHCFDCALGRGKTSLLNNEYFEFI